MYSHKGAADTGGKRIPYTTVFRSHLKTKMAIIGLTNYHIVTQGTSSPEVINLRKHIKGKVKVKRGIHTHSYKNIPSLNSDLPNLIYNDPFSILIVNGTWVILDAMLRFNSKTKFELRFTFAVKLTSCLFSFRLICIILFAKLYYL